MWGADLRAEKPARTMAVLPQKQKRRNHDAKFTERVFKGSIGHCGRIGCG
jgi:hypothetical protein